MSLGSRKKCHGADLENDLDSMISKLPNLLPPSTVIIDGIYTLERGPTFDGKPRKRDLVIASSHLLAADMTGARVLCHDPRNIPYLAWAASDQGGSMDPARYIHIFWDPPK